jgi:hypothetical protein
LIKQLYKLPTISLAEPAEITEFFLFFSAYFVSSVRDKMAQVRGAPGLVKIILFFAMLLLIIDPTFIPNSWFNGLKTG